jgi:hypothetical protein
MLGYIYLFASACELVSEHHSQCVHFGEQHYASPNLFVERGPRRTAEENVPDCEAVLEFRGRNLDIRSLNMVVQLSNSFHLDANGVPWLEVARRIEARSNTCSDQICSECWSESACSSTHRCSNYV